MNAKIRALCLVTIVMKFQNDLFDLNSSQDSVSFYTIISRYLDHLQTHPKNIPCIPRVDNPIIKQRSASAITLAVPLHTIPKLLHIRRNFLSLKCDTLGPSAVGLNRLHHSGELVGAHDTASACGPGEQKSWLVCS